MPRKVQDRGLYLRESSERAGDLLLMEESAVYTVLRFTLSASTSLCHSSAYLCTQTCFLPYFFPALLSLPIHLFLSLLFSSLLFFLHPSPDFSLPPSLPPLCLQSLALFDWSLSLDSPGCIQVKLLIASAVGGVRRWLTAAQPVPVQGAAGLLGGMSCSVLDCGWCVLAGSAGR